MDYLFYVVYLWSNIVNTCSRIIDVTIYNDVIFNTVTVVLVNLIGNIVSLSRYSRFLDIKIKLHKEKWLVNPTHFEITSGISTLMFEIGS